LTRTRNDKCVICGEKSFAEYSDFCWEHKEHREISGGLAIILANVPGPPDIPKQFLDTLNDRQKYILENRILNKVPLRKLGLTLGISGEFVRILEYKIAKQYVKYIRSISSN